MYDPDEYDMASLDRVPNDKAVIFVVATYGDGEPTENAESMMSFLLDEGVTFSTGGSTLENLNYVVFGLGNKSYQKYQEMSRTLDKRLQELGATRIGKRGETDELEGTEAGFLAWKDGMWVQFAETLGLQEGNEVDVADFTAVEVSDHPEEQVYRGELSPHALKVATSLEKVPHAITYDGKNPYSAPVAASKELFAPGGDRQCIHIEFDISGTNVSYQHGDHVGVWPSNPDMAVERLLSVLGLGEKRDVAVEFTALDPALVQVPFPSPATYEAIFRYYLEISAIASRQTLANFARYAPNARAKAQLERWGNDPKVYHEEIEQARIRLGEALQIAAGDDLRNPKKATVWPIPIDRIVSFVPRRKPRWYSISSSPKLNPNTIHATAVALKYETPPAKLNNNQPRTIYGAATSFILNVDEACRNKTGTPKVASFDGVPNVTPTYHIPGARGCNHRDGVVSVPIHTRRSTFRLPTRPTVPVIMVGPGTGVAPFRGFVQDRVALARTTKARKGEDALADWADMHLFYGCRREDEDFLYKEEWPQYAKELDGKLKMRTAFSRGPKRKPDGSKIYVQDLLWEARKEIAPAIVDDGGYVYICGDGLTMSRDVEECLAKMIAEYKGVSHDKGVAELKNMKDRKRFLTDTWS